MFNKIIFVTIITAIILVCSISVQASPKSFTVTFETAPSLDHVELMISITNNQDSSDDFPFMLLLNQTSIDIAKTTVSFFEWKPEEYEKLVCHFCGIENCREDNQTEQTICENITIEDCLICGNHTEIKERFVWLERNLMSEEKDEDKAEILNQFEEVHIKRGETKKFKLRYNFGEIPINPSTDKPGSYGFVYLDIKDVLYYDFDNSSWWDISWNYSRQIVIVNNNATNSLLAGYPINFTLNTTGSKFLDNGSDVIIVYNNASVINRINKSDFNSTTTEIYFILQADIIGGGTNNTGYRVYYGNTGASEPNTTLITTLNVVTWSATQQTGDLIWSTGSPSAHSRRNVLMSTSITTPGNIARYRLKSIGVDTLVLSNMTVAEQDSGDNSVDSTVLPVLYNGNNTMSITSTDIWTDWVPLTIDSSNTYFFTHDNNFLANSGAWVQAGAGTHHYYWLGSHALTPDWGGSGTGHLQIREVEYMEVVPLFVPAPTITLGAEETPPLPPPPPIPPIPIHSLIIFKLINPEIPFIGDFLERLTFKSIIFFMDRLTVEGNVDIGGNVNITGNGSIGENLDVAGNITAANIFLPSFISAHTNNTIAVAAGGTWYNLTFDNEESSLKERLNHTYDDYTNDTFTIQDNGTYEITYTMIFEDSAPSPNAHIVTRIIRNNVEVDGFTIEEDTTKQNSDQSLHHSDLISLLTGDEIKFQFTSDDTTVSLTAHLTFGIHPKPGHITIKRTA